MSQSRSDSPAALCPRNPDRFPGPRRPLLIGLLTLSFLSGFGPGPAGGIASALGPSRPSSSSTNQARDLYQEGRRQYNLGHWREAITTFEQSYALSGDPALLFNLAQAHRQARDTADAIRLFKAFLRERPTGTDSDAAQKQIADLEQQAPPEPIPAHAESSPTAANVTDKQNTSPDLRLPPLPPSPPPATGTNVAGTVQSQASQPDVVLPVPRWLVWAATVTTVALGTAAIVTTSNASSRFQDLRTTCGQTDVGCTPDQVSGLKSQDKVATALWILTGIAAAGAGVAVYADARHAGLSALWRL